MIKIVNATPFPFERIVIEELSEPFAKRGFRQTPTFPLYHNQMVVFARQREGQHEEITLHRGMFNRDDLQSNSFNDEVEAVPIDFGSEQFGSDPYWVSRNRLNVYFIVDGATNWLQKNGKAGTVDEEAWHFTDEADLRRLLRELLPVILAAAEETFDRHLEHNQSAEGKQWKALQQKQNDEISKAVKALGDNPSEERFKAAVLGVLEQGSRLLDDAGQR